MNFSLGDVANAFKLKAADSVMGSAHKAADTFASRASAPAPAAPAAAAPAPAEPAEPAPADGAQATKATDMSLVDPMQWWGALTSQFQQIAASALKDAARQTTMDTTKTMATEAIKTATDMASQFATQGMQAVQSGQRTAAGAEKASAAKKSAAKNAPAASAPKPTAKKATARRAPRKPAG
jgi:hypothetical protein